MSAAERPSRRRRVTDWCFRDRRTGRITIGQWPNLPLLLFGALSLADGLLQPSGAVGTAVRAAAWFALAWWAVDELLRGVNPWRRVLGGGVLIGLAVRLFG